MNDGKVIKSRRECRVGGVGSLEEGGGMAGRAGEGGPGKSKMTMDQTGTPSNSKNITSCPPETDLGPIDVFRRFTEPGGREPPPDLRLESAEKQDGWAGAKMAKIRPEAVCLDFQPGSLGCYNDVHCARCKHGCSRQAVWSRWGLQEPVPRSQHPTRKRFGAAPSRLVSSSQGVESGSSIRNFSL
ncbi:hypothetical protein VTI74DRAFT_11644 [Chaetomium olivicolor]